MCVPWTVTTPRCFWFSSFIVEIPSSLVQQDVSGAKPISKVKYSCNLSESKAAFKGGLKIHIDAVHEKVKYPCNQCEYQASFKHSLKAHIESVHNTS